MESNHWTALSRIDTDFAYEVSPFQIELLYSMDVFCLRDKYHLKYYMLSIFLMIATFFIK